MPRKRRTNCEPSIRDYIGFNTFAVAMGFEVGAEYKLVVPESQREVKKATYRCVAKYPTYAVFEDVNAGYKVCFLWFDLRDMKARKVS